MIQNMQRRPRVICFDMDGTLYQDHVIYPRIISYFFEDTPYASWIAEIQERMERILAGQDVLRCGQFVPKRAIEAPSDSAELFDVPSVTALLKPDPAPYLDRSRYTYVSEGWTLAMYLARRIGWEGEAFWTKFRRARADLVSDDLGPKPDSELQEILQNLRRSGIRLVVCSNAMKMPGWELLCHLELDQCFDDVFFDADKPHTFPQRIQNWASSPEDILFIGDQGYYDLYAGKVSGAVTLLVNPYYVEDSCLWDWRLRTLGELKVFLKKLLD